MVALCCPAVHIPNTQEKKPMIYTKSTKGFSMKTGGFDTWLHGNMCGNTRIHESEILPMARIQYLKIGEQALGNARFCCVTQNFLR